MPSGPLILAALLTLTACATAPEPEPQAKPAAAVSGATERYGPLIEQQAMALVAAEPAGAMPSGLQITIQSVEETPAGLFYNAELHVPARRRREQEYVIYGQCLASDIPACASQIVSGARMLTKPAG
ncbi:MAG TPA: hypothetical protein VFX95_09005 [Caulobacteraceae bacterium]|nr:hypothetical protein [Caulobacteraceae bacterium]